MQKLLRSALAIIAACISLAQIANISPALADTLVTSGGILTGVDGIDVGGTSYDVTFAQGTCAAVFGACVTSNFPFATDALADDAATALYNDIDGSPTYQNDPTQIGLCDGDILCQIDLPLSASPDAIDFDLLIFGPSSFDNGTNLSANGDTIAPVTADVSCSTVDPGDCFQWSVWTAQTTTSPVPEPSTVTMLGAALLGLAFIRRRRGLNAAS